jgi:hypothetical protein
MKTHNNNFISLIRNIFLGLILLLTACDNSDNNSAPTANAGPDQTSNVQVADTVILDGSASSDPDGNTLSYSWSLMTLPPNSAATLDDASRDKPSFIADQAGTYVARLVVNDGKTSSAPDDVSITVVIPPPKVIITAPENLSVVTDTTVTVTGTVDDPGATLTVNGAAITNNNGNYTTAVVLEDGSSNTVTVVGQNSTGEGSASVEIIVNTSDNPELSITSPKRNFITGEGFAMGVPFPVSTHVTVQGVIKVNTSVLLGNEPDVIVNGVAASVSPQIFNSACGLLDLLPPFHCWKFTATIPLEQGNRAITAIGTDVQNRSTTIGIGGVVDYCRIGAYDTKNSTPGYFDSGVVALAGFNHDIQSNRCHEIDGCSAPNVTQQCADDPMQCPEGGKGTVIGGFGIIGPIGVIFSSIPAKYNQASTAFGHGAPPPDGIGNHPTEYFVHGDQSAFDLPCNRHDNCYQTCVFVPPGTDPEYAWENAWHSCNERQHREMLDVCAKAYPPKCPYTGLEIFKCPGYFDEKLACTTLANVYFNNGVETDYAPGSLKENILGGQPSGLTRFKQRQMDYCAK